MRTELPHIIFLGGLVCYLLLRAKFQRGVSSQEKVDRRSSVIDRALVVLVVIGQIVLPMIFLTTPLLDRATYQSSPIATWLGAVVLAGSLLLFWKSHADLGSSWSVSLDLYRGHKLVTNGVYRVLRHPMYASFIAMGFAQSLLLSNWIAGGAALGATVLLYVARKRSEESMMIDGFGDEYRRYMARTGGVLPRFKMADDA